MFTLGKNHYNKLFKRSCRRLQGMNKKRYGLEKVVLYLLIFAMLLRVEDVTTISFSEHAALFFFCTRYYIRESVFRLTSVCGRSPKIDHPTFRSVVKNRPTFRLFSTDFLTFPWARLPHFNVIFREIGSTSIMIWLSIFWANWDNWN